MVIYLLTWFSQQPALELTSNLLYLNRTILEWCLWFWRFLFRLVLLHGEDATCQIMISFIDTNFFISSTSIVSSILHIGNMVLWQHLDTFYTSFFAQKDLLDPCLNIRLYLKIFAGFWFVCITNEILLPGNWKAYRCEGANDSEHHEIIPWHQKSSASEAMCFTAFQTQSRQHRCE